MLLRILPDGHKSYIEIMKRVLLLRKENDEAMKAAKFYRVLVLSENGKIFMNLLMLKKCCRAVFCQRLKITFAETLHATYLSNRLLYNR